MDIDPNSPIGLASRRLGFALTGLAVRERHDAVDSLQVAFTGFGEAIVDAVVERVAVALTKGDEVTVWWWPSRLGSDGGILVPYTQGFSDYDAAVALAEGIAQSGTAAWVKVTARSDESDVKWRWPERQES